MNRSPEKLDGKIEIKHGFPFKSEFFRETGDLVVLTPGNFYEEGGFKRNAEKDKCYAASYPPEYLLSRGDLVVAMTEQAEGLLGSMAYIPEDGKFLHNQRIGLVTSTSDDLHLDYLYHLSRTSWIREQIRLTSTGSKVKHTSPERLYDVTVQLPSKTEQEKIATFLSTIEEKIELNNRINSELEKQTKLLYDYWFVQFDFPITAEQAAAMKSPELEGKPYRASGGKMVFDETLKHEIPEGWSACKLSEFANITMGQSPPGTSYNDLGDGDVFFQGSTDFGWRFPEIREYTTAGTRFASEGDILLSVRAPVGTLNVSDRACCIGRGLAALNAKNGHDTFLFGVMSYFKQAFDRKNASGTTFGAITKDDLYALPFACPSRDANTLDAFEEITAPLHASILVNHRQNLQLAELRDWLLPMLMNGQVSVK